MISTTFRSLFIASLIFSCGNALSNPIGIAATVDGHEIRETKLQASIDQYLQQKGTNYGLIRNPDKFKEVRDQILEVMIGQQLLWNAAKSDGLVASKESVDKAIEEYAANFENPSMFELELKQSGTTKSDFRENIRKRLSARNWLQESVITEISVSEDEIEQFYQQNKSEFIEPEQVRASHILIQVPAKADEEVVNAARLKIESIKQQLDSGAVFAELASKNSEDSSAQKGGDLGYFPRGQMVPPFEKAAFSLSPGQVSDIVRTPYGYHLIMVVDKKPARQYEKVEIEDRIASYLWQQKSREAIDAAVVELRENADISITDY